jgi:signal peptidase
MYPDGRTFVTRDEIMGLVVGYIPYLGWVSIALQKVVEAKYLMLFFVAAVMFAP